MPVCSLHFGLRFPYKEEPRTRNFFVGNTYMTLESAMATCKTADDQQTIRWAPGASQALSHFIANWALRREVSEVGWAPPHSMPYDG